MVAAAGAAAVGDAPIAAVVAASQMAGAAVIPARGTVAAEVVVEVRSRGARPIPVKVSSQSVTQRASRSASRLQRAVEPLRLAFVVQRYGEDVNGGAEYHCRLIAEHLASQHRVEVMTSCAKDYITWRNEHPPGLDEVNGVRVRRFKVKKPRDPDRFGRLSQKVFLGRHAEQDELAWLQEQGPFSPKLLSFLNRRHADYDYFIFFSYRYYHSFFGVRAVAPKAVLVPTAERDEVINLDIFKAMFHLPRAIVYNSVEERAMIWRASGNQAVRGDVVGVGSDVPATIDLELFPARYGVTGRYIIYIGRVDPNKGCRTLFNYYRRYREETQTSLELVLVGGKMMEIPEEPGIRYVGFLSEAEKWSALAGAELLVMPSELESLSMVTNEAWSVGKPVLANGKCDVLAGQCRRSNAGLYFEDYYEFREALSRLESDAELRDGLGDNGKIYYRDHYRWDVVEGKYNRMLSGLREEDRLKPPVIAKTGLLARLVGA
jgi:glycosyltransferase involved in cell wall biosynthesis